LRFHRFGHGRPLVALHGFTFTGEQFSSLADMLGREVIAPDLPGHGLNADAATDVDQVVDAVCTLTSSLGQPIPLLGYSQGGRIALLTALHCAASIERLVLISANAGIETEQLRRNRATQDDALAARIELIGMERFVDTWTTEGLTSTEDLDRASRERDREIRMANTTQGLAQALRGYGQGVQPVVWSDLPDLTMPVLVVAGAEDDRYRDIATRMAEQIPAAELVVVPDARHNPMADQPEATVEAISAFVNSDGRP
jgi:2-succinyl-6-hydroxy-2,4-cyclohexadiene-1-carboxylate synthase